MQKLPKISIITPSYNQGLFLEETIQSVLNQNYPNLEYIIIDGGSSDNSIEIIKKYEKHLSYWVSEKDRGQTHAVNKGLEKATGEIIGWINSDDVYVKGAFKAVAKAFHEHPDAILVHGNRIMIDENSDVSGWTWLSPFNPEKSGFNVCSETTFWRASVNKRLKEDLRFAMDLEFFCRLYKKGAFVKLRNYIGCFRCYGNNKSATLAHICVEETEREWTTIFGDGHHGWRIKSKTSRLLHSLQLFLNPRLIALPYLSRRFLKGRRGL